MNDLITADTERLITRLYKSAFPLVARYVSKMGGDADDAADVFQDALVIYYEKMAAGKLNVQKGEKVYLLGIAKHLWLKKLRDGRYQVALDTMDELDLIDDAEPQPSSEKLLSFLQTAGKKCMDLLSAFYYHKRSMKEIGEELGFAGERSATVQKYKCLEKIRNTVKQNALTYEDFLN